MDDHTLHVLEFHKVLARAAEFAASSPGRDAVRALRPLADLAAIQRRQKLTADLRGWFEDGRALALEGIRSLAGAFQLARVADAALEPKALLDIGGELFMARLVRGTVVAVEAELPLLKAAARALSPLPLLEDTLREAIADDATVTDRASEELRSIRAGMRGLEDAIRARIEAILRSREAANFLQDAFVTQRDGRYVLPVKANYRAAIRGIVHDRSDSGGTLFIEPEDIVEPGNELRALRARERTEIQRILRLLTALVQKDLATLERNHELLVELDQHAALARFAVHFRMQTPILSERPVVSLVQARHPLLLFAGHATVPIDVRVGEAVQTLVITGPNTGGKTVTLKTVGLLTLMAQAGLPVPAEAHSRIGVFARIDSDIGDEQSIEQSLSTFSGHLTRIAEILRCADARTLVLLDELGAGTDPAEGGPLGEAILEALQERGAVVIATTHLSDLKLLAHGRKGMANASVAFDAETLRPTYRLIEGLPGNSNAIIIARRLGIPEPVLARAQQAVGQHRVDLERVIRELHEQRAALERERAEAAQVRAEVLALEARLKEQMTGWKSEKARMKASARAEAEELIEGARREVEEIVADLKAKAKADRPAPAPLPPPAEARKRLQRVAGTVAEKGSEPADAAAQAAACLAAGARVRIPRLRAAGIVVALNERKRRALVDTGGMTMEVALEDLVPDEAGTTSPRPASAPVAATVVRPAHAVAPDRRLMLLGRRAEDAKAELRRYLDAAFLHRYRSVQIVHGYGTGALQDAVREVLKRHPLVGEFRPGQPEEGGQGVTVVELRLG